MKRKIVVLFVIISIVSLLFVFVACNNDSSSTFVIKNGTLLRLTDYGKTLSSVEIPDSVTTIGNSAFQDCVNLTSVKMSDSVTSIENYAFADCSNLKSIDLSTNLKSIGAQAFQNCVGLNSIKIPNGVTKISSMAFMGCSGLTGIIIPIGVEEMGSSVFQGCDGLTVYCEAESQPDIMYWDTQWGRDVSVVWDCKDYGSTDGFDWKLKYSTNTLEIMKYSSNVTDLVIPSKLNGYDVTHIGDEAFKDRNELTSVKLPQSLQGIGKQAFYGCNGFDSITIPVGVTTVKDSAFSNRNITIYCEAMSKPNDWATQWTYECAVIWDYKDHGTTDGINWKLLYSTNTIEITGYEETPAQVVIPPTLNGYKVTSIGNHAFFYKDLLSVELPSSITRIGDYAFYGNFGLSSIVVPMGVTYIGEGALFSYNNSMIIYCEAKTQPDGWHVNWNRTSNGSNSVEVVWGYKDSNK